MNKQCWRGLGAVWLLIFLLSMSARADVTVIGSGGSWQNFGDPINENGVPYFDNPSSDGGHFGVAYFLTGTGVFAGNPTSPNISVANLQYWGFANGTADPTLGFQADGAAGQVVMKLEVAGNAGVNSLRYRNFSDPSTPVNLFTGADSAGATATFVGSKVYLNLDSPGYGTFDSDSTLAGLLNTDSGYQHFAVFRDSSNPGSLWVGAEDVPKSLSDKDFQDMVFRVDAEPAPEASTYAAGGFMLLFAGWSLARHRQWQGFLARRSKSP